MVEQINNHVLRWKKGSNIHIKAENKGKFTSYCGGKVTQECINKGKNSSNPAIRKRATFALNSRNWKHKFGGTLKYQEGGPAPNNWFRRTVDNITDTFWKFGDATGMYDKQSVKHMFHDLGDFGLIPTSSDGVTLGIVAPAITNSVLQEIPLVGTGKAFSVVPTKWSIRSAYTKNTQGLDAAQKAAALDFAEEFGLQTPKFGRGRPSYKGFDGKDVRYNPTTTSRTQRTYAENKGDNIHLSRGALTRYKGDYAQSTNDARHLSEGRPRTKATRLVLIGHLEGSYADSYYGRLWAKILRNEARRGYETPTIKENKLKVLREFAEHYGYYFK